MSKGVISFDLDGVLANFTRGFTRIANRLFGTPVGDGTSQQNWMFEDFPELGLDKVQCDWNNGPIWTEIRNSPNFWADLDPFNTSVMERINRINNKIFITNRLGVKPLEQSRRFLHRWGVKNATVIVAEKKVPVAHEYGVIAHVDDYPKNCIELATDGPKDAYIALHYVPYNKYFHTEWQTNYGGLRPITLSVDHFIDECEKRGLIEWKNTFDPTVQPREFSHYGD